MAKEYKGKTSLTYFLIFLCIAIYLLEVYYQKTYGEDFINNVFENFGFSLQNVLGGKLWVFATSIFLHAGLDHLVLNMLALFFFGRVVERNVGEGKFLITFFISGIGGNLLLMASSFIGLSSATIPTIGASAAIFGLMGTAMLIKPFELMFYPYLIPIPLILAAVFYTLYNVATFLMVLSGDLTSSISYVSHIGGLIAGMLLGFGEEGSGKGLIALIFILILLVATPFVMMIFEYLQVFNYIEVISNFFK